MYISFFHNNPQLKETSTRPKVRPRISAPFVSVMIGTFGVFSMRTPRLFSDVVVVVVVVVDAVVEVVVEVVVDVVVDVVVVVEVVVTVVVVTGHT